MGATEDTTITMGLTDTLGPSSQQEDRIELDGSAQNQNHYRIQCTAAPTPRPFADHARYAIGGKRLNTEPQSFLSIAHLTLKHSNLAMRRKRSWQRLISTCCPFDLRFWYSEVESLSDRYFRVKRFQQNRKYRYKYNVSISLVINSESSRHGHVGSHHLFLLNYTHLYVSSKLHGSQKNKE